MRLATPDDVDRLVDLFSTFFAESQYQSHLTFDPEAAKKYLTRAIGSGYSPHIIAEDMDDGDKIAGTISFHFDNSFSTEPLAVLDEVYALEKYRQTPVGRALVGSMMDWAKASGAHCMHIPITSGHASQQSLINLFKKFGAEEIGTVMRKAL